MISVGLFGEFNSRGLIFGPLGFLMIVLLIMLCINRNRMVLLLTWASIWLLASFYFRLIHSYSSALLKSRKSAATLHQESSLSVSSAPVQQHLFNPPLYIRRELVPLTTTTLTRQLFQPVSLFPRKV